MTQQLDVAGGRGIVARWCALAERRLEYLTELLETGRWSRFHTERAFLENFHEAKAAVETWRDLLSREAYPNNRGVDMSWLGRTVAEPPRQKSWRDQVHPPQPAQVSAQQPIENLIVARSGAVPSAQPRGESPTPPTSNRAAVAERYPLLSNAL
jgi:uncharacterized repeat protein (TIGR03809 family)